MIDKSIALAELVPNANFEIIGDKIICHSGQEVPSEEVIQAKLNELKADYDSKQYQRDRASQYPSIQEQLDMQYWDAVNGTNKWQEAVAKVKTDNPKPE